MKPNVKDGDTGWNWPPARLDEPSKLCRVSEQETPARTGAVQSDMKCRLMRVCRWLVGPGRSLASDRPSGRAESRTLIEPAENDDDADKTRGTKPVDTQKSAARARKIIMETEQSPGFDPTDREFEKLGYNIESRVPDTGKLRFIEVKGRISGASTVTVTRNEILYSLNKPEDFILGIVEFLDDGAHRVHYVREPFNREPDFGVTSVNYDFAELLARAEQPS